MMQNYDKSAKIEFTTEVQANSKLSVGRGLSTHYAFECIRDGKVVWTEEFDNLVVNAGLNDSLDKHLKGSGYTAAWFVGLTGNSPTFDPDDTMASHSGWTEVTSYDESTREALTLGSVAAGSVNNSASKASFTIASGGANIGGGFITSIGTKGGSTGVLYGGGAFSQNRALLESDVLNVTVTLTATAA